MEDFLMDGKSNAITGTDRLILSEIQAPFKFKGKGCKNLQMNCRGRMHLCKKSNS